jgi:hypothetical protein
LVLDHVNTNVYDNFHRDFDFDSKALASLAALRVEVFPSKDPPIMVRKGT